MCALLHVLQLVFLYASNDPLSKQAGDAFARQSNDLSKHVPFFAVNCYTDGQIVCDSLKVTNFPWVIYFDGEKPPEPYEVSGPGVANSELDLIPPSELND
jgi:hypothetical protein